MSEAAPAALFTTEECIMFFNMRRAQTSRRLWEAACRDRRPQRFLDDLEEAVLSGQIRPEEFSVRNCFGQFVEDGYQIIREHFNPRDQGGGFRPLMEAGQDFIDTSAFSNITGQIVYSTTLQEFESPVLLHSRLARHVPTEFNGEKIPGIAGIGDVAEAIGESQSYPHAGTSEEWIETPETTKRGFIVGVTREAIFFDRTNLVLDRARNVAQWLAINKEKRILDAVLGITTSYRRNGTAAQATYANSHTEGDFDNLVASNALQDYTDIDNVLQAFDAITDPNTGEPIIIAARQMIVPSALWFTAQRIINSTETREVTNTNTTTISPNPLSGGNTPPQMGGTPEVLSNQYVKDRTSSDSTWFYGDFQRAFEYRENWPITVTQAPTNNHDEFTRDIVSQFKVSERGVPAVVEPRAVVKCTSA